MHWGLGKEAEQGIHWSPTSHIQLIEVPELCLVWEPQAKNGPSSSSPLAAKPLENHCCFWCNAPSPMAKALWWTLNPAPWGETQSGTEQKLPLPEIKLTCSCELVSWQVTRTGYTVLNKTHLESLFYQKHLNLPYGSGAESVLLYW